LYNSDNNLHGNCCVDIVDIEERNAATGLAGKRARQAIADVELLLNGGKGD